MTDARFRRPSEDPRVTQTRGLAVGAVRQLIVEEGRDAVTASRVSEITGIARSTIYRHWPAMSELIFEAVAGDTAVPPIDVTGDVRSDLIAYMRSFRDAVNGDVGALMINSMLSAEHSTEAATRMVELAAARLELFARIAGTDSEGFERWVSILTGPMVFMRFVSRREITDVDIDWLVDSYLELSAQEEADGLRA